MIGKPEPERPVQARDFLFTLADGDAHAELTEALNGLTQAMHNRVTTHKRAAKGQIKAVFDFKETEDGVVEILYSIDVKSPKPPRSRSVRWASPSGYLTPENPKQMPLPGDLRVVKNEAPVLTAPATQPEVVRS